MSSACASLAALIHRSVIHFVMSPLVLAPRDRAVGRVAVAIVRISEGGEGDLASRATWRRTGAALADMAASTGEDDPLVEYYGLSVHEAPGVLVDILRSLRGTAARKQDAHRRFIDSTSLADSFRARPPPYPRREPEAAAMAQKVVPVYVLDLDSDEVLLFEGRLAATNVGIDSSKRGP